MRCFRGAGEQAWSHLPARLAPDGFYWGPTLAGSALLKKLPAKLKVTLFSIWDLWYNIPQKPDGLLASRLFADI